MLLSSVRWFSRLEHMQMEVCPKSLQAWHIRRMLVGSGRAGIGVMRELAMADSGIGK